MSDTAQQRFFLGLLGGALLFLIGAVLITQWNTRERIDPDNPTQVARGAEVYHAHCAACHGTHLEGQPDWHRVRDNGRMPAPPHDNSGHTWHHPDDVLFGMTKYGLLAGKYAPPGYESDMPAFAEILSDNEIRAALAYIKSNWGPRERAYQERVEQQARSVRRAN